MRSGSVRSSFSLVKNNVPARCPCPRQIQGYRVRLHFDGYPECYDFWANADSWDLKPAGWCEKNGHKLLLPKGKAKPRRRVWRASSPSAFSRL